MRCAGYNGGVEPKQQPTESGNDCTHGEHEIDADRRIWN
jgi:hypothetical protein